MRLMRPQAVREFFNSTQNNMYHTCWYCIMMSQSSSRSIFNLCMHFEFYIFIYYSDKMSKINYWIIRKCKNALAFISITDIMTLASPCCLPVQSELLDVSPAYLKSIFYFYDTELITLSTDNPDTVVILLMHGVVSVEGIFLRYLFRGESVRNFYEP